MHTGYIRLYRRLRDHPRFGDPGWLSVWVFLLLNATHRPFEKLWDGRTVTLKPGQLITGRHAIAKATGVNPSKVYRVLESLKTEQQIEQLAGAKSSIITVLNWERYQYSEQQSGQQASKKQAADEQQASTIQEGENKETGKQEKAAFSPNGAERKFVEAFVSAFKEQFGEDYSHQKADSVQLAKWRRSHPEITPKQLADLCRQVWATPYSRRSWLTLRGICPDWSSAIASLQQNNSQNRRDNVSNPAKPVNLTGIPIHEGSE